MPGLKTVPDADVLYRQWIVDDPRAVVLLVHGMGAQGGRWEFLADFLSKYRFSSYAVELKGYGGTKDEPRGHIASFNIYHRDIKALSDLVRKENPGKKVFILGESMGGLLAFVESCLYPDGFAGAILISPAFKNGMKFPFAESLLIFASFIFNRKKQFRLPFSSAMCTRDYEYQKKMDSDPRESRVATAGMLWNNLAGERQAWRIKGRLTAPVLFLVAGVDMLVDPRESRKMFEALKVKDKQKIEYSGMYHALSIEKGREKVFGDILAWLEERS